MEVCHLTLESVPILGHHHQDKHGDGSVNEVDKQKLARGEHIVALGAYAD